MGADIYLRSIFEPVKKKYEPKFNAAVRKRDALPDGPARRKAQEAVSKAYDAMYPDEGYFRDSYNASSLSGLLDFSWWQDIVPMLDKEGNLPISKAKKFIRLLESKPVTMELVMKRFDEEKGRGGGYTDPPEEWLKHWTEKRERLIAMLKRSIELNEPLDCSL